MLPAVFLFRFLTLSGTIPFDADCFIDESLFTLSDRRVCNERMLIFRFVSTMLGRSFMRQGPFRIFGQRDE
jgi:hypothetical protein